MVSNLKPQQEILGVTPNERTLPQNVNLLGCDSDEIHLKYPVQKHICSGAIELAQAKQMVESGDIVVLTAGLPSLNIESPRGGVSNMMRIATVD